jgi:hypothetical protein
MGLSSTLFKDDKRLNACQVDDAAHLTLGTKGDYVAKVQLALYALDWLAIDRGELLSHIYGPSTAKAVRAYKTKRKIINRAYQNTPDDIVGKMTITRLDQEMVLWEQTHRGRGDCACAPSGGILRTGPLSRHGLVTSLPLAEAVANSRQADQPEANPRLNKALHIYCSITKKSAVEDGYPIGPQVERAKNCLFEYGMVLSVEFVAASGPRFADQINFPSTLVLDEDVALLRKASEDTRQGFPSILRVIVAPRSPNAPVGETFRNVTVGAVTFRPFVVLNSKALSDDATVLHEMIHAAHDRAVKHDDEQHSVFFKHGSAEPGHVDRTWLKPDRAVTLSKSFFAV